MKLKLELENIDEVQAKALAQFIKRIEWSDIRAKASCTVSNVCIFIILINLVYNLGEQVHLEVW